MRPTSLVALLLAACGSPPDPAAMPVQALPTEARAADGRYIAWTEHIIDDEASAGGVAVRGGDGIAAGDIDRDGMLDFVSAQEDGGYIRIAYGSEDPNTWFRLSLANKPEATEVEDVNLGDLNGDGYLDVIAACEEAHLLYLQNPATEHRGFVWAKMTPEITLGRGAWIRAFFADFDRDGRPEVVAANRGQADGSEELPERNISWFSITGNPLAQSSWQEHVLSTVKAPINSQPVDLDGDGDLDVVGGSRGERRVFWFENTTSAGEISFVEHPIESEVQGSGFNLAFHDFNADGRLDIVLATSIGLAWLEQPAEFSESWTAHRIGDFGPDLLTGFVIADIDGDGDKDLFVGSYSHGPRLEDGEDVTAADPLGRIGWFQNPGDAAAQWTRHDIVRRKRGMFDSWVATDLDKDGDLDFVGTRGNSAEYDGVFWLEQRREDGPVARFSGAREQDSQPMPLP